MGKPSKAALSKAGRQLASDSSNKSTKSKPGRRSARADSTDVMPLTGFFRRCGGIGRRLSPFAWTRPQRLAPRSAAAHRPRC